MNRVFLLLLSLYLIEFLSLLLLLQFSNNLNQNVNLHIDTENIRVPLHMSLSKQSPSRLVHDVNCRAIFKGDASEIEKANNLMKLNIFKRKRIEDREYIQMTKNCMKFRSARGYDNHKPSSEEALFPIAYSILLYKDVEQFERLLCAIYSPYNYFCLHIDADTRQEIHDAVRGIANCFHNVFIVHRNEFIVYAGFSRLQAELNCIEELLQNWSDWTYFINLPSQEFPLKTNQEIVRILKTLNGANDISGLTGYRSLLHRYKHRHIYKHVNGSVKAELFETNQEKESPPHNITLVKGSAYGIFSREFVHFAANNKIARELLFYLRDVYSPDEYFWATLNFNLHIKAPGSYYRGRPEDKPYLTVYASWRGLNECNDTWTMINKHIRRFLTSVSVTICVSFAFLKVLSLIGTNTRDLYHTFISQTLQTSSNYLNESIFINVQRVRILQTSNVKNRRLNILWINKPVWCNLTFLNLGLSRNCPYQNCRMTTDKKNMKQMAAIVFSTQDGLNPIPPFSPTNRPRDQIWVFFRREPPTTYKVSWYRNPKWIKTMNWSWGYRLDSDIFYPYGTFNKRNKVLHRNYSQIYKNKSRDAAWAVGHCSTQSRRAKYVSKLQSVGLSVDIFGKCSPNKRGIPSSELESLINRKYKFYLAFESSICKDYVTEKLFTYFGCDTVLLVRGGFNYSMHFDKSAFIDTADFASFKDVADFLKKLGHNETLYTQYLLEKDKYIPTSVRENFAKSSCVLCEKLNNIDDNQNVYDNIETYMHSNTCFSPKDIS